MTPLKGTFKLLKTGMIMTTSSRIASSRRVLMRTLCHQEGGPKEFLVATPLPPQAPIPRSLNVGIDEGLTTFTSPRFEPEPNEAKQESIYNVQDADDILKVSPGGEPIDTVDYTQTLGRPGYNYPQIPNTVRR